MSYNLGNVVGADQVICNGGKQVQGLNGSVGEACAPVAALRVAATGLGHAALSNVTAWAMGGIAIE